MNTARGIEAVGLRVRALAKALPDPTPDPTEVFERHFYIATAILDSEWQQWPEGSLEIYLKEFLAALRIELGLPPE